MSKHKKYQQLYGRLLDEVKLLHERIKVGIRQGLKMLLIVPLLFMVVMFLTQGSKGIFLVLWIVSTFVIAAFLIALEYVDHGIQKRLEEITGMENELPDDSLMPEIELPEIDIEELRLAAQERRSQLPLRKLKEKLANGDASADTGETAEEAAEEEAAQEAAEPIIEALPMNFVILHYFSPFLCCYFSVYSIKYTNTRSCHFSWQPPDENE